MNKVKRLLAVLLMLATVLPVAACGGGSKASLEKDPAGDQTQGGSTDQGVHPQIVLTQKQVTLQVGRTFSLVGAYTLKNCTDETVSFGTSDPMIATVTKDGVVRALTPGKATITLAVANGAATEQLELTVVPANSEEGSNLEGSDTEGSKTEGSDVPDPPKPPVRNPSITLSFTEATLTVGESKQIAYTLTDCAQDATVSFASSSAAATVNVNGLITAVSAGVAEITVTVSDGVSAKITLTVKKADLPESKVPHYEPTFDENVTYVNYTAKNVKHVFFHNLIAFEDTTRHFDKDCLYVSEFKAMLEQLYENGYVLINIDYIYEYYEENGVLKAKLRDKILVPKGKTPLIMSVDNVCYPANEHGLGRVDKLVVKNGKLYTYTKLKDGTDFYSDDNEVFTILESFIEQHPDFSFSGARMVVSPSGYAGLFGYNTTSGATAAQKAEAEAEVPKIVDWFRGNGYTFACHSYSHGDFNSMSVSEINADFEKWDREVLPYIGKTHVFIYPFGNFTDLRKEGGKDRAEALFNKGFAVYCATSMNGVNWDYKVSSSAVPLYLGICYNERIILDGQCLRKYADHANMKALFDAYSVYDNSQREIKLLKNGGQSSVKLDQSAVSLEVGGTVQLSATVVGLTAKVHYTSDNPCVAVDQNGKVTALAVGRAKITATCGLYTAVCTVTVTEPKPAPKIELNIYHLTLSVGDATYLTASCNVEDMTFVWTSSNEEALFVDDGNIRALTPAEAVLVKVIASDGSCEAQCMVDIVE